MICSLRYATVFSNVLNMRDEAWNVAIFAAKLIAASCSLAISDARSALASPPCLAGWQRGRWGHRPGNRPAACLKRRADPAAGGGVFARPSAADRRRRKFATGWSGGVLGTGPLLPRLTILEAAALVAAMPPACPTPRCSLRPSSPDSGKPRLRGPKDIAPHFRQMRHPVCATA